MELKAEVVSIVWDCMEACGGVIDVKGLGGVLVTLEVEGDEELSDVEDEGFEGDEAAL